ncbi:gamma-type small acid-soluble spore protein [Sporosarcina sp. BI001-red]|uniref:gamma-type small acid-soluble spore protein n=1 Tax=Sporosarcina sp. BI001-red TaxID=2282866 RepID=UPI000E23CB01|nr:gamma-type small acid-soluble spore protein [Sporosarcina sp. BI001-red]REB05315.1 gamma-type small acid-soluble spore protein [Sporosarcina sp. BI001-red]
MTTNNQRNQKNNQQYQQNNPQMNEEFGAETDVQHVKQQNQKAEANKRQASGQRANSYGDQTK